MTRLQLWRRTLPGLLSSAVLTLAVVAVPVSTAWTQELRIAVEGEYPPFNKTDKKGKLSGFDVDIAKALCKALDASCEFVKQRWDRIIPDLVDGKYDLVVSSMSITAERRLTIGALAGLLNGAAAMPGPPVIAMYLAAPQPIEVCRASLTTFFLLTAVTGAIFAFSTGLIDVGSLAFAG